LLWPLIQKTEFAVERLEVLSFQQRNKSSSFIVLGSDHRITIADLSGRTLVMHESQDLIVRHSILIRQFSALIAFIDFRNITHLLVFESEAV